MLHVQIYPTTDCVTILVIQSYCYNGTIKQQLLNVFDKSTQAEARIIEFTFYNVNSECLLHTSFSV